jgi:hypothetical protein
MSSNLLTLTPPFVWGFLVGFVGWASCFRLAEPIVDWLLPVRSEATIAKGIARFLVTLFLIFAVLFVLAMMPVVLSVGGETLEGNSQWRRIFGATFIGSLVGFLVYGLMTRSVRNIK